LLLFIAPWPLIALEHFVKQESYQYPWSAFCEFGEIEPGSHGSSVADPFQSMKLTERLIDKKSKLIILSNNKVPFKALGTLSIKNNSDKKQMLSLSGTSMAGK
jgi:hypothetical protein